MLLAIVFAAGCQGSAEKLVDRAVLQAVSGDQNWVAYFTGTEGQSGTVVGNLSVLDRGAQSSRPLAAGAFNVSFSDGDVLSYTTGLTVADDNGARALYGPLSVWAPSLAQPVVIDQGLSVLDAMSIDRSAIVSFDAPLPHRTPQQTGNVLLARAPDWTPMQIASGPLTTLTISSDGRFAAWVSYVAGATSTDDRWQSWLYSIADGRASMLGSSVSTNLVAFSPSGGRIATANGSLALQVFSTESATLLGWSTPTSGLLLTQAAFSDDDTLVVRMRASGTQTLWRTTELQATMLGAARDFALERTSDGSVASRFLFASTMVSSSATQDLVLYDLSQATPQPQMLSATSNGPGGVSISDDLTRARFLDAYDPNQAAGALTIVDLSTGKPQAVAPNIQAGGSQFLTGGATLYWLDNLGGDGTLWSWNGGANVERAQNCYNFRTRAPSLFVTLTAPDPQSGANGPGIWQLH